jgi:hypothetical protein
MTSLISNREVVPFVECSYRSYKRYCSVATYENRYYGLLQNKLRLRLPFAMIQYRCGCVSHSSDRIDFYESRRVKITRVENDKSGCECLLLPTNGRSISKLGSNLAIPFATYLSHFADGRAKFYENLYDK